MKKIIFPLIFVFVFLFLIAQASAFVDFNVNADNAQNVKFEAFNCLSEDCSSVAPFSGSFPNGAETSNGNVVIRFPSSLATQYGYAVYAVSAGYLPKVGKATFHSNGNNGIFSTTSTLHFEKAPVCRSAIGEFSVANNAKPHIPLVISVDSSLDATASSAFGLANSPVKYIPSNIEDYFSASSNVVLTITNIAFAGEEVYRQAVNLNLKADASQRIEFSWTPGKSGDYVASVSSDVTDSQCASSEKRESVKIFSVAQEEPKDSCYVLLNNFKQVTQNPKAGQKTELSFDKISNHADISGALSPVKTEINYFIKGPKDSLVGKDKFTLNENPDSTTAKSYSFEWVPQEAGLYTIGLVGTPVSNLCGDINDLKSADEAVILQVQVYPADVSYSLTVKVINEKGEKVSGALASIDNEIRGTTDANGEVLLARISPGDHKLEIKHKNYEDLNENIKIESDLAVTKILKSAVSPPDKFFTAAIKVFDSASKEAIAGASVQTAPFSGEFTKSAATNNQGVVVFENLRNGNYFLRVEHLDYEQTGTMIFSINNQNAELAIFLQKKGAHSQPGSDAETGVAISSLSIPNGFEAVAGEQLDIFINLDNAGNKDLENTLITASIPELGIKTSVGPFDLNEADSVGKRLALELPAYASKGQYYVRVSVHNSDVTRTVHRLVEIV